MTNFFGWIEVGYIFSDETTFEDVLLSVKKQFEEELVKEKQIDMIIYNRGIGGFITDELLENIDTCIWI